MARRFSWLCLAWAFCVASVSWEARAALPQGRLRVLTYNVAGLPEGLSAVHPRLNLPRIGELLDRYDLALIQEDYAYPELLRQRVRSPYASSPFVRGEARHFGDGLSQFGRLPFGPRLHRTPWRECHGIFDSYFDCLTPKGLSVSRVTLLRGVEVDVYNVHLDAGPGVEDRAARSKQLAQLAAAVRSFSVGRAVVVGGDFNLTRAEFSSLASFESATGLRDACALLKCAEPARLDRILVRSSTELSLSPRSWRIDHRFRDHQGRPLSDHLAVAVEVDWASRARQ